MRAIKFRAWDKRWPKGDPEFAIAIQGQPDMETLASFAHHYMWNQEDIDSGALVLMQSTGLRDKNGMEIYEVDVLERRTQRDDAIEFTRREVKWIDDYAQYTVSSTRTEEFAVIGNIYENPELLELRG